MYVVDYVDPVAHIAQKVNYANKFFTRKWKVNGLWNAILQNTVAIVQHQNVQFQISPAVYSNPADLSERADLAISALVGGIPQFDTHPQFDTYPQFDTQDIPIITFQGKVTGTSWTTTRKKVENWCDQVNDVHGQAGTSIWAIAAVGKQVKFWIYSNRLTQQNQLIPNNRSRLVPVSWNTTGGPSPLRVDWAAGTNGQSYRNNTGGNADAGIIYHYSDEYAFMIIRFMLEHPRGAGVPHIAAAAGAVW